jgi:hypothetical protein
VTGWVRGISVGVVLIPLTVLWAAALFHILRRRPDLSPSWKGIWSAIVLLLPYLGVLAYSITRPPRRAQAAGSAEPDAVSRALARLRTIVDEHDRGEIGDGEYEAAKSEIFGLADDPA